MTRWGIVSTRDRIAAHRNDENRMGESRMTSRELDEVAKEVTKKMQIFKEKGYCLKCLFYGMELCKQYGRSEADIKKESFCLLFYGDWIEKCPNKKRTEDE